MSVLRRNRREKRIFQIKSKETKRPRMWTSMLTISETFSRQELNRRGRSRWEYDSKFYKIRGMEGGRLLFYPIRCFFSNSFNFRPSPTITSKVPSTRSLPATNRFLSILGMRPTSVNSSSIAKRTAVSLNPLFLWLMAISSGSGIHEQGTEENVRSVSHGRGLVGSGLCQWRDLSLRRCYASSTVLFINQKRFVLFRPESLETSPANRSIPTSTSGCKESPDIIAAERWISNIRSIWSKDPAADNRPTWKEPSSRSVASKPISWWATRRNSLVSRFRNKI